MSAAVAAQKRILRDRNSVHDIQRVTASGDRAGSTNGNLGTCACNAASLDHLNPCGLALQRRVKARARDVIQLPGGDLGYGAGHVALALRAIPDNDHIIHDFEFHPNVHNHFLTGSHGQDLLELVITDVIDRERVVSRLHTVNGVVAIAIGHGAIVRTFQHNRCARQRGFVFVQNHPGNRRILSGEPCGSS